MVLYHDEAAGEAWCPSVDWASVREPVGTLCLCTAADFGPGPGKILVYNRVSSVVSLWSGESGSLTSAGSLCKCTTGEVIGCEVLVDCASGLVAVVVSVAECGVGSACAYDAVVICEVSVASVEACCVMLVECLCEDCEVVWTVWPSVGDRGSL